MKRGLGRVLVLGAGGNVGTLLMAELARRGASSGGGASGGALSGAVRPGRIPPREPTGARWVEVDLAAPGTLEAALLANGSVAFDTVLWTPSVGLLPSCLDALERAAPGRVVIISSASVHTRLQSGGARMKREAEARVRASGLRFTVIRPTMIYGNARDRNLTRLLDYLERCPLFPLFGDGSGLMQPVFIDDLVETILRAAEEPSAEGKSYDVGAAASLTYRELVETAAAALGKRARFVSVPLGAAAFLLRTANRLGLRFLREEQVLRLAEDKVVDNGPVIADLGVHPRGFQEGIARQVERRRGTRPDSTGGGGAEARMRNG